MWAWLAENGVLLLSLGTVSGVITTLMNQGVNSFREHRKKARGATYLSLRVATELENFGYDCHSQSVDMGNYISSRGSMGQRCLDIPALADYPADNEGWTAMVPDLADQVMSFRLTVRQARGHVAFFTDFDGPQDAEEVCVDELVLLADEAMKLAKALRDKYGLKGQGGRFDLRHRAAERAEQVRAEREVERELAKEQAVFVTGNATAEDIAQSGELLKKK